MTPKPSVVADIMTRDVVTLHEGQSLEFLPETMRLFKFRHMPVVDDNRLLGLISDRDLLRVSASSLLPASREQTRYLAQKFSVQDIMTRNVTTVRADTPLTQAAMLMEQGKLGCLPVVEGENSLVGIVTEADFVTLCRHLLNG